MKVALFFKKENNKISARAKKVARQLTAWGIDVLTEKAENTDLIVSIGGDGTLLRTVHQTYKYNIPILGIHSGGLGFLNEIEYSGWETQFKKIISGRHYTDRRHLLKAEIIRKGKIIFSQLGLNDAVINKSGIARVIVIGVSGPKIKNVEYLADGLIISSATGSTAYNLSAGGKILKENSRCLAVTPICPHQLKLGAFVSSEKVKVKLAKGDSVFVTVDGQSIVPFKLGDTLMVYPRQASCRFIRLNKFNQLEKVRKKLGRRIIYSA
jgi:NAD+ kinase